MNGFYGKKDNLIKVLGSYLAIFSEGQPCIVPTVGNPINLEETFNLPCYAGFPESEKSIWREAWSTAT